MTWKLAQLIGVLLLLVGVAARTGLGEFWGTWLAVTGTAAFAVARVGAWLAEK